MRDARAVGVEWLTSRDDVERRAGAFLAADPIRNNMVAATLRHGPECDVVVADHEGGVGGVGLMWGEGVTLSLLEGDAARLIADALVDRDIDVVDGPLADAAAVAGRWTETTGGGYEPFEVFRVYELGQLTPPTGIPGHTRPITVDEIDRELEWDRQFGTDTGLQHDGGDATRRALERMIRTERLIGWEVDREIVSRLAISNPANGAVRIGGVFTPHERRGSGYASALTAGVSAQLRRRGDVDHVVLNTQASNPGTNRLYRRLGYRSVFEWLRVRMIPAD